MLQFREIPLPDPLQLFKNCPEEGMKNWPPLYITEFTAFFMWYVFTKHWNISCKAINNNNYIQP